MNFYQHQDRARRRTTVLGALFVLAVLSIVTFINAALYGAARFASTRTGNAALTVSEWLDRPWWAWTSAAVLLIIVGSTLVTTLRLAGGGPALARMLRARRVRPDTGDFDERRLMNIVEEMSIASGVPVPALYVLDEEPGINAFVAGTRPSETVMVVTRGALQTFSRDEMQGVVAHEYSHIFNRDMHLNLHLMGALAGLIVIAQIGRFLLRSGTHGRNRNASQIALVGLAILVAGYVGSFFGAVIKAAISRQREFLADASAVQFTRNPDGIAHALYRIKRHGEGSLLNSRHAEDISHFCFGESVHYLFSAVMATHPPLDARIRAIDPHFQPPPEVASDTDERAPAPAPGTARHDRGEALAAVSGASNLAAGGAVPAVSGARIAEAVGTVAPAQVAFAHDVHAGLPEPVLAAVHDTGGAAQVVLALLYNGTAHDARPHVLERVATAGPALDANAVQTFAGMLERLPARRRLPLLQLALPTLKTLDGADRATLRATVHQVIEADARVTAFEFAVIHLLDDHLDDGAARPVRTRHFSFGAVADELRVLLSVLAHAGSTSEASVTAAFATAWKPFGLGDAEPLARGDCSLERLGKALAELAALSPLLQKNVIQAAADCVIHDFTLTAAEEELLQAVALNLDCPLPPLLGD